MEPRKVHFIPGGLYLPLWILNDGNLTARQAAVYAVIWHLSQGGNDFHGTLDFLCDCAKINSRSHVSHILKNLIDKGYIIKRTELLLRNKRINHYQPVTVVFDNLSTPVDKNATPVDKIATREIKKNNIYKENNIKERKNYDNRTTSKLAPGTKREDLLGQLL